MKSAWNYIKGSKWRIIISVFIACVLLGTSAAFAGGVITVNFSSGAHVGGTIHVVAPDPTIDDIIVTVPEITITFGSTDPVTFNITAYNNSGWVLTLKDVGQSFNASMGKIEISKSSLGTNVVPKNDFLIPVTFTPSSTLQQGDYSWEGNLTFSW